MTSDRTIHAEGGERQIVRYDRAGVWCLEYEPANMRPSRRVGVNEAVRLAVEIENEGPGGYIYVGLPGGSMFDRKVRALRRSP